MKNVAIALTAIKIEWHWWFIKKERIKGNLLLAAGYSLSSSKMLQLNRSLSKHSAKAVKAQNVYMCKAKTMKRTNQSTHLHG